MEFQALDGDFTARVRVLMYWDLYFPFVFSNPETFFGPRNQTGYTALLHPDVDHGLGNVDSVEEAAEQLDHLLTIEKVRVRGGGARGDIDLLTLIHLVPSSVSNLGHPDSHTNALTDLRPLNYKTRCLGTVLARQSSIFEECL